MDFVTDIHWLVEAANREMKGQEPEMTFEFEEVKMLRMRCGDRESDPIDVDVHYLDTFGFQPAAFHALVRVYLPIEIVPKLFGDLKAVSFCDGENFFGLENGWRYKKGTVHRDTKILELVYEG